MRRHSATILHAYTRLHRQSGETLPPWALERPVLLAPLRSVRFSSCTVLLFVFRSLYSKFVHGCIYFFRSLYIYYEQAVILAPLRSVQFSSVQAMASTHSGPKFLLWHAMVSTHFVSSFLVWLRMMLVGIWLELYWVLFSFFDHYI